MHDAPRARDPAQPIAAITLDLHDGDKLEDIRMASQSLRDRGVAATFFVPSGMFRTEAYRTAARGIAADGHEVASHTHAHDYAEIEALMSGTTADLAFLAESRRIHEEILGSAPVSFRSPAWCHLSRTAVAVLSDLGYRVDSSSTPGRLGVFSSTPFANVWTFAPRAVHMLTPSLMEVPNSSFLVPAGSPSFSILRSFASRLLVSGLAAEARTLSNRVLCVQFHASAFNPHSTKRYTRPERLTWKEFLPLRRGGLGFKRFLRSNDSESGAKLAASLVAMISSLECLTMTQVHERLRSSVSQPAE